MKTNNRAFLKYSILAIASTMSLGAGAQNSSSDTARALEEVIVTARRTEESIQSVPVTITAFNNEMLREKSISTLEDLQLATPGLRTVAGNKQNMNISIRGQSKVLAGIASPAVLSYFADVPSPNFGSYVPQFDMGSIQVLKGPQGTLFGRNTTGGAVLFTPAAPTDVFEGYVQAGVGNYENQDYEAVVNIPVNDRVRLRLGAAQQKREGYTEDLNHPGRELDDIDDLTLRASLWVEPVDGLTNLTIVNYFESDTHGEGNQLLRVPGIPPQFGFTYLSLLGIQGPMEQLLQEQMALGPRKVKRANPLYVKVENSGVTNRTEWEIADLKLVNIFGYRESDMQYTTDSGIPRAISDGTGAYPAGFPVDMIQAGLWQDSRQVTNEVQLHGDAFDDDLSWLLGYFYLSNKPAGPQSQLVAFGGSPFLPPSSAASYGFLTEESRSVFAHASYSLDKLVTGLELEVGIRHVKDEQELCTGGGTTPLALDEKSASDCPADLVNGANVETSSSANTWSVGLNWQVTDDVFAYLVSRRGYRAGGVNAPSFSGRMTPFQTFSPEEVNDYELGIRSDIHLPSDALLRLNLSVFTGKYTDVQTPLSGVQLAANCDPGVVNPPGVSPDGDCDPNNDPSGGTLLVNAGESKVSGFDLAATLQMTDALSISAAASILDPKTEKFTVEPALQPYLAETEIPFNFLSKETYTAGVRYQLPINAEWGELVFNADYYKTTSFEYGLRGYPGYDVVNARLDWNGLFGSALDLSVYGRNLLDNDYWVAVNASGDLLGLSAGHYGPPRTYGIELRYSFGGQ